jgi:hypothetical protein
MFIRPPPMLWAKMAGAKLSVVVIFAWLAAMLTAPPSPVLALTASLVPSW